MSDMKVSNYFSFKTALNHNIVSNLNNTHHASNDCRKSIVSLVVAS